MYFSKQFYKYRNKINKYNWINVKDYVFNKIEIALCKEIILFKESTKARVRKSGTLYQCSVT